MIRFFRTLIIIALIVAGLTYAALWLLADYAVKRIEGPLTRIVIGTFGPGEDDAYTYNAAVRFLTMTVDVTDLRIEANALDVDGDVWLNSAIGFDKIECELMPLIRRDEVVIRSVEGRKFIGYLTNSRLIDRLERDSDAVRDLSISEYDGHCRITGQFGLVDITSIVLIGDWAIDDRGVVTMVNRQWLNPDSPVPEGYAEMLNDQTNLDIRVEVLGEEVKPALIRYDSNGLYISAQE